MDKQLREAEISAKFGQAVTIQSMKDANDEAQRKTDLEIQASEAADSARMDSDDDG